jgi:uncharacterized protein YjbI with pentapeptide repeats
MLRRLKRLRPIVRLKGYAAIDKSNLLFLENGNFSGSDWSGRRLASFTAVNCHFKNCLFQRVFFEQACFGGGYADSAYEDCTFDGSTIHAIAPGFAKFQRCSFRDVDMHEFFALGIEMVDCVLSGTFRKGFFNGTVPLDSQKRLGRTLNEFVGNDFANMRLIDVDFRTGIDLNAQLLPPRWQRAT